ncbi:ATPase [Aphanothece hegewaldii CCALA 016]|uniref:ATPase n=1 Tax=Aphanothece hegewaldii CCALA 016 TaxID=2107694 RepID=A0A2T1M2D7_9CHRO|nr:ATP-binding protein [Aphanothece hegewaldii]PSF38914.1 ATPase [Aphanothece hegewaldii CCALA 016]
MIKQLILQDWKSFHQATLYFDPLTVVIGTNASGKSNLVDALSFLQKLASGQSIEQIWPEIRGGLKWVTRKDKDLINFILKVLVSGENSEEDYLYTLDCGPALNDMLSESITLIKPNSDINLLKQDLYIDKYSNISLGISAEKDNLESQIEETFYIYEDPPHQCSKLHNEFSEIDFFGFDNDRHKMLKSFLSMSVIKTIFVFNPIPSHMRNYSPLSKNLESDASNIAGFLSALPKEKQQEINNIILKYIKQLPEKDIQRIWAEPVGILGSDAMLYCEESWKKNKKSTIIDARAMSDGTLRFLAILTAMLTRPEGSQIVIEEVDNGLHPSRTGLLLKMLREIGQERKIDVLVTTHNPALLDQLDPDFIPFVMVVHRDIETGDSVITPLDEIENLPKLMASGTLGKITTQGLIEDSLDRMK